ncbi:hypothetical protein AB0M47_06245 [Hamadaea sp. NPDC051192]|uniref:hypothetical protein n=1 Tax=Hamadaea sp. NPDC051192 TaxID=3154940 RepID=UPI0034445CA8
MLGRKLGAALAVVPAVVTAVVFAVSSPAAAACSTHSWSDKDPAGANEYTEESAPLRTGPYEDCSAITTLPTSTALNYHCFITNSYGNTWTHVKVKGRDLSGWIWDNHLKDNGSPNRC